MRNRKRLPGDVRPRKNNAGRIARRGQDLICTICYRQYKYYKEKGHNTYLCNSCNANRKRYIVKKKCVEYKGGKCEFCGYSKCLRALGFHHKDRNLKAFNISSLKTRAWHKLQLELDKCYLLCANCHMEEEDRIVKTRSSLVGEAKS